MKTNAKLQELSYWEGICCCYSCNRSNRRVTRVYVGGTIICCECADLFAQAFGLIRSSERPAERHPPFETDVQVQKAKVSP